MCGLEPVIYQPIAKKFSIYNFFHLTLYLQPKTYFLVQYHIMYLYNTLSRKIEDFKPIHKNTVKIYCCGPTVYDFTHLGHLRKYAMDDVIVKTLKYFDYDVKHVMNITDVGHLVGDSDEGEDKLEKGARKTGRSVWEVAKYYTGFFEKSMKLMSVNVPDITCKATDHIESMIKMIKVLEEKGFTYETEEAVYFDISKDGDYGILSGQKLEDKKVAVRDDVNEDKNKKNPADFALWFKRVGRFADHTMHWNSPWGDGFPGWHIECSAMSTKYLGSKIDIHTGGIDHIPVHHTNEIAQSECATGEKPFVKYWVHHNFLTVEGQKMSKSLGNFFTIDDVLAKGFYPEDLRFLFLQSHYRSEANFTWDSLSASHTALKRLVEKISKLPKTHEAKTTTSQTANEYEAKFRNALSDDINTSKAISVLWEMIDSDLDLIQKKLLFENWNKVLGIDFSNHEKTASIQVPHEVSELVSLRKEAKLSKDFAKADSIRKKINDMGYDVSDAKDGTVKITKL